MKSSRRTLSRFALVALAAASIAAPIFAQDLHPSRRKSPLGSASAHVGDGYALIVYGRPYKRDRDNIFGTKESGAVVPFGERWRLGANEATEIALTKDLVIGGKKLAAGVYSMTAKPGADKWTIHFNSELGLDGTGHFDRAAMKFTPVDLDKTDVLVVDAKVSAIPADKEEVDQFTIEFEKGAAGTDLVLRWIRTEARVAVARAK
jgi:hypothetical protein